MHQPVPPAARLLFTLLLLFGTLATRGQGSWTYAFQSDPSYLAYVRKVVVDPVSGDTWVTGSYSGTLTLDSYTLTSAGNTDVFVARRSAAGQWLWALSAGGGAPEDARGLALDPAGNAYVCGGYYGVAIFGTTALPPPPPADRVSYVARISPQGQWEWVQQIPGPSNLALNLAWSPAGHVVVGGIFKNNIVLGTDTLRVPNNGTNSNGFIGQLDPATGQWEWAARAGGPATAVGADATGGVYMCGYFFDTAPFGTTTLTGAFGVQTGYIGRLSATGQWQWAQAVGGAQDCQMSTLVPAPDASRAYVGGSFSGTAMVAGMPVTSAGDFDLLVISVDSSGPVYHAERAGGPDSDGLNDLTLLPDGRVLMAGRFSRHMMLGTAPLGSVGLTDIMLAVWQPDSTQHWTDVLTVGGNGNDTPISVAAQAFTSGARRLVLGGTFQSSSLAFGTTVLSAPFANASPLFLATWDVQANGLSEESGAPRFELVPNPAHHTVRITGGAAGPVRVLDALGQEVRTVNMSASTGELDLTDLPAGLYLVRVGGQTRRLVVE